MVTSQGIHLVFDRSFLKGDTALMVPKTSDGRVLFVIPWHGHAVAGTTDTPVDAPSLEPRPLDEEIEFILETAGRYLSRPPSREDVLAVYVGLRPLVKARRRQDFGPFAGSVDSRRYFWTADDYRREVDNVSAHGGGLRGPCHHAGRAAATWSARPRICKIHGYLETRNRRAATRAAWTFTAPMRRQFASSPKILDLAVRLHSELPYIAAEVVWAARAEMARTVEDVLARRTRALFLNARAATAMAGRWRNCLRPS